MTPPIGSADDLRARLRAVLPTGWFPDTAPLLDAVLTGIGTAWSAIYAQISAARTQLRLATATDTMLDAIGGDFFGTKLVRKPGEADTAFRATLQRTLLRERGTRAALVTALTNLTARTPVLFEPSRPADTGGYGVNAGNLAFGAAGGWGSLALPCQVFVTAYRPLATGIAAVPGYGAGAYTVGPSAYASLAALPGQVTDADMLAAIVDALPAGAVAWTRLLN